MANHANHELIEAVKTSIRKKAIPFRKEIFNTIKDIEKYPIVLIKNLADKIEDELHGKTNEERIIETKHRRMIGFTCLTHPFFNKLVYHYSIPPYMDSPVRIEISLYINIETMKGIMLFNYMNDKKVVSDMSAGILPIIVNQLEDGKITITVGDISQPLHMKMAYQSSLSMLTTVAVANGIEARSLIASMTGAIHVLLGDLHVNNYYPFSTGINRRGEGGEIIYLNRIPTKTSSHTGESVENEKAPHMRRGYWWTMRSERYKSHPNYQIENANYRQAAWVGPEQFNYKGKTYKILIPKDEMFSAGE